MTREVADISSYQDSSVDYLKTLRQYASSLLVKLTEGSANGSAYINPKAGAQVANGLQVFESVGVYHFFKANSQFYGDNDPVNEAKFFLSQAIKLGLDKTTVMIIDVEDASVMADATHDVNLFLKYLNDQGYMNTVVYASASWFKKGGATHFINKDALYNNAPIWVASYGTASSGVAGTNAWQYTDNGHGLKVDFSYDLDGCLSGIADYQIKTVPNDKPETPSTTPGDNQSDNSDPLESGMYEVIADKVTVYTDPSLTATASELLTKGSRVVCVPTDTKQPSLMIGRSMYLKADKDAVAYVKG
ncbi:GH25 family lysozyme [Lentilactobacillus kosonis]|uniref:Conserved domain protein n=1 Tax=Lentilactobacillus kosonis TaxID=2810561 RepID=A0A401FPT2_9LACO|nr:GH25 family lysozyme [Lentilactobacillus kosonis]GAY74364.1 conserved domain protein [Lentilactobacillus kosonis]